MTPDYAIIQQDRSGLFYWIREKYEKAPNARIIEIFKGTTYDELEGRAKRFIELNKGKSLTPLTPREIVNLL